MFIFIILGTLSILNVEMEKIGNVSLEKATVSFFLQKIIRLATLGRQFFFSHKMKHDLIGHRRSHKVIRPLYDRIKLLLNIFFVLIVILSTDFD